LKGFRKARAITAPGIIAETVIPAYNPRYAFADPNTIARNNPTNIAFNVNSGIILLEGIKDLKFSRESI
jgi:hypothetical protein